MEAGVVVCGIDNLPPLGVLLIAGHLHEVDVGLEVRVQLNLLPNHIHFIDDLLGDHKFSQLFLIKIALGTLF